MIEVSGCSARDVNTIKKKSELKSYCLSLALSRGVGALSDSKGLWAHLVGATH